MRTLPISPIFIPANRLDFCHKAISSGADGVILDLEDSIPLDQKDSSLRELVGFLKEPDIDTTIFVRINPPNTDEGKKDLAELSNVQSYFSSIIIPKAENIDSFIGVELDEEYFGNAKRRIHETMSPDDYL